LDEDYCGDGPIGIDETQRRADSVERLRNDDPADYGWMNLGWETVGEEFRAGGVAPAPVKQESEEEDVAPIDQESGAVVDEFS